MTPSEATDSGAEPFADGIVHTDVLGPHAKVKILAVLIANHHRDLNPTEVARMAGIDRSTCYEHIDDLLAYDLIEQNRTVGNSPMYRIDRDSAAAEDLVQLEWDLIDAIAE